MKTSVGKNWQALELPKKRKNKRFQKEILSLFSTDPWLSIFDEILTIELKISDNQAKFKIFKTFQKANQALIKAEQAKTLELNSIKEYSKLNNQDLRNLAIFDVLKDYLAVDQPFSGNYNELIRNFKLLFQQRFFPVQKDFSALNSLRGCLFVNQKLPVNLDSKLNNIRLLSSFMKEELTKLQ